MEKLFLPFLISIRYQRDKIKDITGGDFGRIGCSGNILLFTLESNSKHQIIIIIQGKKSLLLSKENIDYFLKKWKLMYLSLIPEHFVLFSGSDAEARRGFFSELSMCGTRLKKSTFYIFRM